MAIGSSSIGIPDGFEVDEGGATLRIEWRWPRLAALALAIFAVAWNGFLVTWYVGVAGQDNLPVGMLILPIAHVAVGLTLPYVALVFLVNTVFVEVGLGTLTVRHRPLPFPGNRTLNAADIQQLFCVERKGRKGDVTYDVMVQRASGQETRVVTGLRTDREARFVEQRIERYLGLADRSIDGELPR